MIPRDAWDNGYLTLKVDRSERWLGRGGLGFGRGERGRFGFSGS